jgi:hypothetical protein
MVLMLLSSVRKVSFFLCWISSFHGAFGVLMTFNDKNIVYDFGKRENIVYDFEKRENMSKCPHVASGVVYVRVPYSFCNAE